MDTVEIVIITIAIVLLIVLLYTFNYMISQSNKTMEWPPKSQVRNCPDFWTDVSGVPGLCQDDEGLLDASCSSFTYNKNGNYEHTFDSYNQGYTLGYLTEVQKSNVNSTELAIDVSTDGKTLALKETDADGITISNDVKATYAYFDPEAGTDEKKNWKKWVKKCGISWDGISNVVDTSE